MGKNLFANAGYSRDVVLIPGLRRFPWSRTWQPTPGFSPGKSHGQGSLGGCSPRDHKGSDMSEQITF